MRTICWFTCLTTRLWIPLRCCGTWLGRSQRCFFVHIRYVFLPFHAGKKQEGNHGRSDETFRSPCGRSGRHLRRNLPLSERGVHSFRDHPFFRDLFVAHTIFHESPEVERACGIVRHFSRGGVRQDICGKSIPLLSRAEKRDFLIHGLLSSFPLVLIRAHMIRNSLSPFRKRRAPEDARVRCERNRTSFILWKAFSRSLCPPCSGSLYRFFPVALEMGKTEDIIGSEPAGRLLPCCRLKCTECHPVRKGDRLVFRAPLSSIANRL